jgi:hypothetical protein
MIGSTLDERTSKRFWRTLDGPSMQARILALLFLLCICSESTHAAQRRRIYFLESVSPTTPAAVRTIEGFKKRLGEKTTEQFEIFVDYLEAVRLPSQAHKERMMQYLSGKYAEAPADVLITLGRAALPFITKYREAVAPNVPIILTRLRLRPTRYIGRR